MSEDNQEKERKIRGEEEERREERKMLGGWKERVERKINDWGRII